MFGCGEDTFKAKPDDAPNPACSRPAFGGGYAARFLLNRAMLKLC